MSYPTSSLSQILTNQNSSQTADSSQAQNMAGNSLNQTNQQPIFTQQQLGLQGQAGNLMNQILTGDISQFGPPQATYDAAFANFNKYQAPQLAAQYGSGSPAIGAGQQELQQQIAGMWGQMAMPNALNAFNAAAQYGFNPIAMNQTNLGSQNQQLLNTGNQTTNTNTTNTDIGGLLGGLGSFLP